MTKMIRECVLVALLAGAVACSGPAGDRASRGGNGAAPARSDSVPEPTARDMAGMPNARMVGTDMMFGGQPAPEALATLAAQGYRTIVTTRGEGEIDWNEASLVDSLGMQFISIPMAAPIDSIPDAWLDRFDAVMREAERPMLLHCSSGNRVAGLWAVWLAERGGLDPARALELGEAAGMARIRPVVEKRLAAD